MLCPAIIFFAHEQGTYFTELFIYIALQCPNLSMTVLLQIFLAFLSHQIP